MKATGIVRKIDNLGRVVIPKELRDSLDLQIGSFIEFYVDDDGYMIMTKSNQKCFLCGTNTNLTLFKGKKMCHKCINYIKEYM